MPGERDREKRHAKGPTMGMAFFFDFFRRVCPDETPWESAGQGALSAGEAGREKMRFSA